MIEKVDSSHYLGIVTRLTDKVNELVEIVNKQQEEIKRLKGGQSNLNERTSSLVVCGPSRFNGLDDNDFGDIDINLREIVT